MDLLQNDLGLQYMLQKEQVPQDLQIQFQGASSPFKHSSGNPSENQVPPALITPSYYCVTFQKLMDTTIWCLWRTDKIMKKSPPR